MSDLTEFLLARLTDDEDAIRSRWNAAGVTDEAFWGTPLQPSRALAECKPKRSLVGLLQSDSRDPHNAMRREWADEILRALAAVYADHADYREEWR